MSEAEECMLATIGVTRKLPKMGMIKKGPRKPNESIRYFRLTKGKILHL